MPAVRSQPVIRICFQHFQDVPIVEVGLPAQSLFTALACRWASVGGAIYNQAGTYATAFLAGFAFNFMNLLLIAALHLRQTRMGLRDVPARTAKFRWITD
jgi:hypothetical protein